MKKLVVACFVIVMVASLTGQAIATKPGNDVNPNGFPSGKHFNLNIIAKKPGFTCPEQKYEVTVCTHPDGLGGLLHLGEIVTEGNCPGGDKCVKVYGKVIFVPETGQGIEIYMQSGKKGGSPKNRTLPADTLQVIDPCATDGTPAVLQLPPEEEGYHVYARALATPTETPTGDPSMTVTPALSMAEDENGDDLFYLGLVTNDGFAKDNETFTRKKGKSVAVPITDLFLWSGTVCYLVEPEEGGYVSTLVCGIDDDGDGFIDRYVLPDFVADPVDGCLDGVPTTVYCREYSDEWVFNIADFVDYLWDVNNNGLKLLQIRFYPVDPEPEPAPSRINTLTTKWGQIKTR